MTVRWTSPQVWTLKNTGDVAWPEGTLLRRVTSRRGRAMAAHEQEQEHEALRAVPEVVDIPQVQPWDGKYHRGGTLYCCSRILNITF